MEAMTRRRLFQTLAALVGVKYVPLPKPDLPDVYRVATFPYWQRNAVPVSGALERSFEALQREIRRVTQHEVNAFKDRVAHDLYVRPPSRL